MGTQRSTTGGGRSSWEVAGVSRSRLETGGRGVVMGVSRSRWRRVETGGRRSVVMGGCSRGKSSRVESWGEDGGAVVGGAAGAGLLQVGVGGAVVRRRMWW